MKTMFSEYGKVMVAIIVAVAFLVILFAGSYFKDGLRAPFGKDTNIEHEENGEVFAEISKKSLPSLIVRKQKIAKNEVVNLLDEGRVEGVCYIVDYFGDFQYEVDENGNPLYETNAYGNYILDENGNRQKKKATDPDNIPTLSVAVVDVKSVVEVDGENTKAVTEMPDIKFKALGSNEWIALKDIETLEGDNKEVPWTLKHYTTHTDSGCVCGAVGGVISEEDYYNTPGTLRVKYRLIDKNNAETFVDVDYIIEDYLETIEEGAKIGGND